MPTPPRLLLFAGSARTGSFNVSLLRVAERLAAEAGAHTTTLDLAALELPVYHAAVEAAGMPAGALALRDALADAHGLIVASPEYNAFPTPLLVNSLAWASRVTADARPSGLAAVAGKPVGLLSASPGALGGLRSLMAVRQLFTMQLGTLVLPEQFALGGAARAFDADGALVDPKQLEAVRRVVGAVIRVAGALG